MSAYGWTGQVLFSSLKMKIPSVRLNLTDIVASILILLIGLSVVSRLFLLWR